MPPWAVLLPSTATSIDARRHGTDECLRQLVGLPSRAWVSIVDDHPLSRLRLRRLARLSGLVIERELIVLPTLEAPVAVVEDAAAGPVRPLRALPWSWTRRLASHRVLVARRP